MKFTIFFFACFLVIALTDACVPCGCHRRPRWPLGRFSFSHSASFENGGHWYGGGHFFRPGSQHAPSNWVSLGPARVYHASASSSYSGEHGLYPRRPVCGCAY